jgi:hypothetical protein
MIRMFNNDYPFHLYASTIKQCVTEGALINEFLYRYAKDSVQKGTDATRILKYFSTKFINQCVFSSVFLTLKLCIYHYNTQIHFRYGAVLR